MKLVIALLVAGCVAEAEVELPETSSQSSFLATPWSTPVRIAAVSVVGYLDTDPAISSDGLELYFISDRGGGSRIYMTTRFSTASPWGPPVPVTTLWGPATSNDSGPELSHDGLTIWFSRSFVGEPEPRLYMATRAIRSLGFSPEIPVEELAGIPISSPHVSPDGLTLYFANADAASRDIFTATRPSVTSAWRNIRALVRFTSSALDDAPTTARAEREAYFESTRGGALRIYRSTRTVDTAWTTPAVVDELAGASRADVSPDGTYLVMTMVPIGGDPDLYEARR